MRTSRAVFAFATILAASFVTSAQATVVIIDPTKPVAETKLAGGDREAFDRAIPKVRARLKSETCEEMVEVAGVAYGGFSRAGADETLVFYQYCQTGNGLGWVGLVLIEGVKVTKFWSPTRVGRRRSPARRHRTATASMIRALLQRRHASGEGGVGVESCSLLRSARGIGWFQAEKFMDPSPLPFGA